MQSFLMYVRCQIKGFELKLELELEPNSPPQIQLVLHMKGKIYQWAKLNCLNNKWRRSIMLSLERIARRRNLRWLHSWKPLSLF